MVAVSYAERGATMMLDRHGESFFVQENVRVPSGFPPPHEWKFELGDSTEVLGMFIQSQSDDALIAGAQGIATRGRFAAEADAPVDELTVLRRARDNTFIRLIGDPIIAPEMAIAQIKVYAAEITERPVR